MLDLTVVVISWKRPHLLKQTLTSLELRLAGLKVDLVVIDNESMPETRHIIESSSFRCVPLHWNAGINYSVQDIVAPTMRSEYICVSDHDIYYGRDLKDYCDFLRDNEDVMAVRGMDSPEHEAFGTRCYRGETWLLKKSERGAGLFLRSEDLRRAFPLPGHVINFDWHLVSKGIFGVLPATCAHLGWKDSTRPGVTGTPEQHVLVNGKIVPVSGL